MALDELPTLDMTIPLGIIPPAIWLIPPPAWALVFGSHLPIRSAVPNNRKIFETLLHLTAERIQPTPRSILPYVSALRHSDSYTHGVRTQVDSFDASNNTSPSTSTATSVDSPPAKAKSEKPVCWDFLHGRCRRWVCYFRHEYPPEQQSANATPSPKSEADTVCVTLGLLEYLSDNPCSSHPSNHLLEVLTL